jgi:hypothetical protein
MNDSIEFTPKEKYLISLYQDPEGMFRRAVIRRLWVLVPSIGLAVYGFSRGDIECAATGYAILLLWTFSQLSNLYKGLVTIGSIFRKYEAQLQRKQDAG